MTLDKNVGVIGPTHLRTINILGTDKNLERCLQLGGGANIYSPLEVQFGELRNSELLFRLDDPEYHSISRAFNSPRCFSRVFNLKELEQSAYPYHHILNLPNTVEDVKIRQKGVKDLIDNPQLYNLVEEILSESNILYELKLGRSSNNNIETHIRYKTTPEDMKNFFDKVISLQDLDPQSSALRELVSWAQEFSSDTYFQELFREKRRVTDSRILQVFSERFKGFRYGVLKKGVKLEEVMDFIDPDCSEFQFPITDKRGNVSGHIRKAVAMFKTPYDENVSMVPLIHGRQRMDILNILAKDIAALPTYLMKLQIKHLFQGAYLHKAYEREGISSVFPKISENSSELSVEEMFPIRIVLENLSRDRDESLKPMTTNSFEIKPEERIIQIKGPNRRGKSEAWRTIHLLNVLTNAGYTVPATTATVGIVPTSHFISCKGNRGYGGSEFQRSLEGIMEGLNRVNRGDTVILDEFGDSTNPSTAEETARRLIPILVEKGCRLFITSHNDSLTNLIQREMEGVSFTPDPSGDAQGRFRIIRNYKDVDFKARETLDEFGFTKDTIRGLLSDDEERTSVKIEEPNPYYNNGDDEIPF